MHSPPVQPTSSSSSGTGSVRTMWEEAIVSRPRSGPRGAFAAPPIASTAAPARTMPPSVRASTPPGAAAGRGPARTRRSRPRARAAARAGRTPGAPAAPSPRRGRGRRRGRRARRSGRRPPLARAPAPRRPPPAHGRRPAPRPRLRRGRPRSRPAGSRPRRNQASTPCASQKSLDPVDRAAAARATASAASSPQRSRMFGSENHITLQKPPLRPLGPCPQRSRLEQHDPRLGLQLA